MNADQRSEVGGRRSEGDTTVAPEVFYFGYAYPGGHVLQNKRRSCRYEETPWGEQLDGGLLGERKDFEIRDTTPMGRYVVQVKGGWTAVAFWDRSGDSRPASNSAFLVAAMIPSEELLRLAKEQWPEIWARPGFPLPLNSQAKMAF